MMCSDFRNRVRASTARKRPDCAGQFLQRERPGPLHLPPGLQHGRQRHQDLHEGRHLERPHPCLQTWAPKKSFCLRLRSNFFLTFFSRWLRSPRHDWERPSCAAKFDDHLSQPCRVPLHPAVQTGWAVLTQVQRGRHLVWRWAHLRT
jgi:hypothetical protein